MSCVHQKHMNFHSMEHHKPRMLKDFLNEKISNPSCSSNNNGFESLPRKPSTGTSMRTLIEKDLNSNSNPNSRDSNSGIRSKTKLSKSPFQTVLNAVKAVTFFTAVKKSQPAVICGGSDNNKSTAKMKDIMKWKLCRDPAVAVAVAAEEPSSTAAVNAASCSSSGWSCWSESDLSSWECDFEDARNDVVADFEFSLFCFSPLDDGEDCVGAATGMAKVGNKVLICQAEAQHSPVSVLQLGVDEFSPFDQSLANNQRTDQTFMQHIKKFETLEVYDHDDNDIEEEEEDWVEKRARELLHYVKSTGSMESSKANLDKVLLDIFMEELNARRSNQTSNDGDFELNILRIAKDWIDGSFTHYDSEHDNRNVYIKDMDWRGKWGKYKEDQEELALEIENTLFHSLVGEIMGLDC